jgi:PAS domain-containing protein
MLVHDLAAVCGEDRIDRSETACGAAAGAIGIAVIGADDRIEYCNAQYPKLWGIPARGLIDGPRGEAAGRARMNGILFRQDAIRTRNLVRLGDGRSLELVTVSARDPAGSGLRRVTFVRDVTPAKPAEALRLPSTERVLAGLTGALALLTAP